MRNILFLLACLSTTWLVAQSPVPAPAQAQPIAITGATAHLGNGEVIENALITFAEGKLTQVTTYRNGADLSGHQVIDAAGKHVYPGLIAPNSQLGLVEIGAVRATRDESETGEMNPNVRSLIAFNTDSQVSPTVRSRGVMLTQATPDGGTIAGQSSVMHLDGWNWEDAAVRADDGVHVYWPRRYRYNWRTGELMENRRYSETIQELQRFLDEARAYCAGDHAERNLKLEAMCGVMSGERNFYVHADMARDIEQAVVMARANNLSLVIVGGAESFMITDLLRDNDVAVIVGPTHALPSREDYDVDQPFKTPAMLHEAGVRFCLSQEGFWEQRNLPFMAGTAVAYGLPYEEAIRALTLSTAEILGVNDRVGSLEAGKDATLIVCAGDLLDMRTSQVERAFIEGRDIDLDNKQDYLYRKFSEKYSREQD
ncbi:MAG: amidohydrolase family protein [Lewinella sp.]|nr:amidohydrolase family protein [Lewinella sp.]